MTKQYISPKDTAEDAELLNLRITIGRPVDVAKMPPSIEKLIPYFLENIRDNPSPSKIRAEVIPKLEQLIEQFPTLAVLYNYLVAALERLGEHEKLAVLLKEQYQKNPDYLFARINYAHQLLRQGGIEEIPEIFAHTFALQTLYPQRKEFHVTEVIAFCTFMALYQDTLEYKSASEAWIDLASSVAPGHPEIKKFASLVKNKQLVLWQKTKPRKDSGQEHFPPSTLLVFATPEQDLIDIITPMLPIPCTILPHTAENLKTQGIFIHSKTQVSITSVFDGGHEGGVICTIEHPAMENDKRNLAISITHVIIKPKHKAEMRVQAYQRKRIAQLKRENG